MSAARSTFITAGFFLLGVSCKSTESPTRDQGQSDAGRRDVGLIDVVRSDAGPDHTGTAGFQGWKVLPIRSQQEYESGAVGGESEQHPQGIARCLNHPEVIYLSHDIAAVWKSADGGKTWKHTLGKGIFVHAGQSIEVDPVDPDRVLVMMSQSYNHLMPEYAGVYRSDNGGETWDHVLPITVSVNRRYQHQLDYCLGSVDAQGAKTWYTGTPESGLYRSDDYGKTWTRRSAISANIYDIECDPQDADKVYLATTDGLYCTVDGGQSVAACGNLARSHVSSIEVSNQDPRLIYATLYDQGLWKTTTGVGGFSEIRASDAFAVFINPGFTDRLYLVSTGRVNRNSLFSKDGGQTFTPMEKNQPFPGLGRTGGWKQDFYGLFSGIVPNPNDADEAVAFAKASLWKTTDSGLHFVETSTLWTGYAWGRWGGSGIAFDRLDENRWFAFHADTGMTVTRNKGASFSRRTGAGLFGYYSGDLQPNAGSEIVVASSEGCRGCYFYSSLVRTTNEGADWDVLYPADTKMQNMFVGFDPSDPQRIYAGDKVSTDAGATWTEMRGLDAYDGSYNAEVIGLCRSAVFAVSGNPRDRLLRSTDGGDTWNVYSSTSRMNVLDSTPTIAVDANCNVYAVNASTGDLRRFDGTRWTDLGVIALAGGHANNHVRGVAIDPTHPDVIYAGLFQPGISQVWRSVDRGTNWEDIGYNLPKIGGVNALKVNPHTGELFLGSGIGTWVFPPPEALTYSSSDLLYDKDYVHAMPSCFDGLQNGDETGKDVGGACGG